MTAVLSLHDADAGWCGRPGYGLLLRAAQHEHDRRVCDAWRRYVRDVLDAADPRRRQWREADA
jgi:hypothetical protein